MNRFLAALFLLPILVALPSIDAQAQTDLTGAERIALWEDGVPGFEERRDIPEVSDQWWTRKVNDPSLVHFAPPAWQRTGTSVIIMPGGAHEHLVTTSEGVAVARWYAERGVDAFVLYYRLAREEGAPWTIEHTRQDAERAMRLVRARAVEFGLDRAKIGVIGFSAGGELARMTMLSAPVAPAGQGDAIDQLSARPDFGILVFPGPMKGQGEVIAADAPPVLLSAAADDDCCAQPTIDLFMDYRAAGASAELHLYAQGGHAYNMGEDSELISLQRWPERIVDWMIDRDLLPREAAQAFDRIGE